ncbi:hypothetical protein K0U00_51115, partial [Paenibacillus sepulcri]|nr:hypothetical protein [Paenibacillus sepulcri]
MLQEMDSVQAGLPLRLPAHAKEDFSLEQGLRIYSFVVLLHGDERGLRQSGGFQETLVKLADGLFPGNRWTNVIRTGQLRFLL